MADLEFFFDPICPWAWITSRFTVEVAGARGLDVRWRLISLVIVNEARDYDKDFPVGYRNAHGGGRRALRVAAAVDGRAGNEGVAAYYTALGTLWHDEGLGTTQIREGDFSSIGTALARAGLPAELEAAGEEPSWDEVLRRDTETALARTGKDVGTPILTFSPGQEGEASIFGPVVARIPRGEEAVRVWDAMEVLTRTPYFAELKRSARQRPEFG